MATAATAAGVTAMTTLTVKALDVAGELEQNMGGSVAVFDTYAAQMQNTAKTAYKDMGLSASDFLATANKMGALMQGSGLGIEESANLSAQAMQRAADVASIMGIDVSAAMESVAGAAKGNFTMMDNLGVAMNATTLEAYALSKGITTAYNDMDNATKVQLAMQMFLEKTEYAAGNYAKENETLAGSLNTAKAAMSNFLSGAGDVDSLVDSFVNAGEVIVKNLTDIVPRLAVGVTGIIEGLIPHIIPMITSLLPTILEGTMTLMNGLLGELPAIMGTFLSALDFAPQIIELAISLIGSLIEGISANIPTLTEAVLEILVMLIAAFTEMFPQFVQVGFELLTNLMNGILSNLPTLIQNVFDMLDNISETLITWLPELIEMGVQIIAQLILGIAQALPDLIPTIVNVVLLLVDTLLNNIDLLIDAGIELLMGLALGLVEALPQLIEKVPEIIMKLVDAISRNLPKIANAAGEIISTLAMGLLTNLPKLLLKAKEIMKDLSKKLTELSQAFSDVGKNIIEGIWTGIKNGWSGLVESVKNLASELLNAAKSALGIHSPSRKFAWIGEMCVAGMDEPLEEYNPYDTLKNSMQANIGGLKASFAGSYIGGAYGPAVGIDYNKLGDKVADAMARSGFKIEIGRRELGRVVREVIV